MDHKYDFVMTHIAAPYGLMLTVTSKKAMQQGGSAAQGHRANFEARIVYSLSRARKGWFGHAPRGSFVTPVA
jgi:hypothetical protein